MPEEARPTAQQPVTFHISGNKNVAVNTGANGFASAGDTASDAEAFRAVLAALSTLTDLTQEQAADAATLRTAVDAGSVSTEHAQSAARRLWESTKSTLITALPTAVVTAFLAAIGLG